MSFIGTINLSVKGPFFEDNGRGGKTSFWEYTGARTDVDAQYWIEKGKGATMLYSQPMGDGNWQLRSGFPWGPDGPGSDPVIDTHELDYNVRQPSVFEAPNILSRIGDSDVETMATLIKEWKAGNDKFKDASGLCAVVRMDLEIDTLITESVRPICKAFFRQVCIKEMEAYQEESPIYRRTITAASPSQVVASFTGAGKVWKTEEVLGFEGLPSGAFFVLPTTVVWLKSKPRVIAVAQQKTQISYTYTGSPLISSIIYPKYSSVTESDYYWVP